MITNHFNSLQCKDCSKILDERYSRGLLRFIFDNESVDIIGLKCPDCNKIFIFKEANFVNTFKCKSCGELYLERGSDIGRDLCSICNHTVVEENKINKIWIKKLVEIYEECPYIQKNSKIIFVKECHALNCINNHSNKCIYKINYIF